MQMVPPQLEIPSAPGIGCDAAETTTGVTIPQKARRRALVVPREHGAWGMLLVPLLTGAAVVVRRLGWTELAHAVVFGVLITAGFGLVRSFEELRFFLKVQ